MAAGSLQGEVNNNNTSAAVADHPPTCKRQKIHCDVGECSVTFSCISNLLRHKRHQHGIKFRQLDRKIKCSECGIVVMSMGALKKHLKALHCIDVSEETLTFDTEAEFDQWKKEIEKRTTSSFVVRNGKKNGFDGSFVRNYECHRSGSFVSRSTGRRVMKMSGSNKIGANCPAGMRCKVLANGQVNVNYCPTHTGHGGHDPGRLVFAKNVQGNCVIDVHLEPAGVRPMIRVLQDNGKFVSRTKRFANNTTGIKECHRMMHGSSNVEVVEEDDATAVSLWVEQIRSLTYNSIFLYKPQGQEDPSLPECLADDFLLGFMNEAQEDMFRKHGNDIVSIDSTHGTTMYAGLILSSIVVVDDNREGFPVAFFYHNRQSKTTFRIFFAALKERVSPKPNCFMSDDCPAFYNAWECVFGPVNLHLICAWHVQRAWHQNLSKISCQEMQKVVFADLQAMQNEVDEEAFRILLESNIAKFVSDPKTKEFGKYFQTKYSHRPRQWAYCYRKMAGINTNMRCEQWHRDLKESNEINSKADGRLDSAICNLMQELQQKIVGRAVIGVEKKQQLEEGIAEIRMRHELSLEMPSVAIVEEIPDKKWSVSSLVKPETYVIEKLANDDGCNCDYRCDKCQVCIHQFSCSCLDSRISSNMCKHIHLVCHYTAAAVLIAESEAGTAGVEGSRLEILTNCAPEMPERELEAIAAEFERTSRHGSEIDRVKSEANHMLVSLSVELNESNDVDEVRRIRDVLRNGFPRLKVQGQEGLEVVTLGFSN